MEQRYGYGHPAYTDDFRQRHEAEQEAARKEQEEMQDREKRARATYLQGLEDARVAERVTHEERIVATFEPQKQQAKRQ